MKTRRTIKSVLTILLAFVLSFGFAGNITTGLSNVQATDNYGSLVGSSFNFTVQDVRDNSSHTFTAGDGKTHVLIFSGLDSPSTDTDNAIKRISAIKPYLDEGKFDVFVLDLQSDSNRDMVEINANSFDHNKKTFISCYDNAFMSAFYKCTISCGLSSYYYPLIVYVDGTGNIYNYTTGGVSDAQILASLEAGGVPNTYYGRTIAPDVEVRTPDQIKAFVASHPVNFRDTVYDEMPSVNVPYSPGKLNDSSLQDALNMVNQVRYIAGLSYDVTLSDQYNTYAQYGSLVDSAIGLLTHCPTRPTGMNDDMYYRGYDGANRSNIARGYKSLSSSVVYGYMFDGDSSNILSVGHRRWVLNPYMGKTGFGMVPDSRYENSAFSAMYAMDSTGYSNATMSMWPAFNMPIEYFGDDYPWSLSTGSQENLGTINVELKNKATGQTWVFTENEPFTDGELYIDNDGYGLRGCIIFRPYHINISEGDTYSVKITGTASNLTIAYDVNFFSLNSDSETGDGNEGGNGDENDNENDEENGDTTDSSDGIVMYRLYNPNSGEHFYTKYAGERDNLVRAGWNDEGTAWTAPSTGTPVYRLYNENGGEHHYTKYESERRNLISIGWKDEGIGWYSADENSGVPVYRLYNPNEFANNHHYTTKASERDWLVNIGWNYEGIAWYGIP